MISMAASLDKWLIDRTYYGVGTDMSFAAYPLSVDDPNATDVDDLSGEWIPLPAEFVDLKGIESAARVGDFSMSTNLVTGGDVRGRFLAVDRVDFANVAWFREDFADEPLMGLMNRLATADNAILIPQKILEENHLMIGDQIPVRISINYALNLNALFTIAGTYEYFPAVYPDDAVAFIGNLNYFTYYFGVVVPHNIWLLTSGEVDGETIVKDIRTLGIAAGHAGDARGYIQEEQAKQERVGVFGTLTIGFLAAVVMAAMGLLIYTYASLRDRLKRFTILRAVGLLRRQIMGQVVLEYAVLTAYGAVGGAFIGKLASDLFIPFFRVTGGEQGVVPLPPLIPIIAESDASRLILFFVSFIVLLEVIVITRALSQRAFSMLKDLWG
jgi:putative ABC transport system permease protein